MKKVVIIAMVFTLCISLVGCGAYFDALEDVGSAYQEEMDKLLGEIAGETPANTDGMGSTDSTVAENNTTEPSKETESAQITMPYDSWHYTGHERPVGHIVSELEKLGFTNITMIEVEKGWYYFSVEDVKIYSNNSEKMERFDEGDVFSADALVEVYYYGGPMEDGMIQGTNAKTIENTLRAIQEYNWWDGHSLTQSSINDEWSVSCSNNEYNTYTKSYDLSAYDTLEIQYAQFKTYDFDYEYLLLCASLFDTDLIDADEVKQWVQEYEIEDGTIEQTFGDAIFTMRYHEYDDGESYVELSVWACGDINSN